MSDNNKEEKLKENLNSLMCSEESCNALVESIPEAIIVHRNGKLIYVNQAAVSLMGAKSKEDLLSKSVMDLVHPDFRKQVLERVKNVIENDAIVPVVEEKFIKLDGTTIDVEVKGMPIIYNGEKANCAAIRNITEEKNIKESLKLNQLYLSLVFNNTSDMQTLFEVEESGKLRGVAVNRSYIEALHASGISNFSAEDFVGQYRDDLLNKFGFSKEIIESEGQYFTNAIKSGLVVKYEQKIPIKNSIKIADASIIPIMNNEGKCTHLLYSLRDVTEEKNKEDKLIKSELRFRTIFESSVDAIMTLEPPTWKFTSGNPATLAMFKAKDEKEFEESEPWKLSPEKQPDGRLSSDKAKEMIEKAMNDGYNTFDWTHKRLNGEDFTATVSLIKIILPEKAYLQAIVRDVTDLKKAENNLRDKLNEMEKMNKLMVGRELEMINLKNKIVELEEKLKVNNKS